MADDGPEDATLPPDSGRAKRAPPTIDLEASEVTAEAQSAGAGAEPTRPLHRPSAAGISAAFIAAITSACVAALVIGVAWFAGWPGEVAPPAAAPQASASAIDALTSRVADIETKAAKPTASPSDPAAAARIETLEKSLASLRGELAGQRAESERLAAAVNDVKSAPREAASPPDLSAVNERIAEIERATRAQIAESAQQSSKPWRRPCWTFRFDRAIPTWRRWRPRNRLRRIRMR